MRDQASRDHATGGALQGIGCTDPRETVRQGRITIESCHGATAETAVTATGRDGAQTAWQTGQSEQSCGG